MCTGIIGYIYLSQQTINSNIRRSISLNIQNYFDFCWVFINNSLSKRSARIYSGICHLENTMEFSYLHMRNKSGFYFQVQENQDYSFLSFPISRTQISKSFTFAFYNRQLNNFISALRETLAQMESWQHIAHIDTVLKQFDFNCIKILLTL